MVLAKKKDKARVPEDACVVSITPPGVLKLFPKMFYNITSLKKIKSDFSKVLLHYSKNFFIERNLLEKYVFKIIS